MNLFCEKKNKKRKPFGRVGVALLAAADQHSRVVFN
jgi:hypothetical protein